MNRPENSRHLIDALLRDGTLPGAVTEAAVIETHISWVILAADHAFKIKKPVNLGFVDFTTLESRRRACVEELRLNRRLAPELYLGIIAIHGSVDHPTLVEAGPVLEYAVRMRRFPPGSVLTEAPVAGLAAAEIDDLAALIAGFHRSLPCAAPGQHWGRPEQVWAPVPASLAQLGSVLTDEAAARDLRRVREYLAGQFERSGQVMDQRSASGAVRECHGDLHLGNLVRIGGRIVPFDALEFDPALRWIDVMNEVAFLVMDLMVHGRRDLAFRFLNGYLDVTGDREGLQVLPFYLGYRALVRAKIRALSPAGAAGANQPAVNQLLAYAGNPLAGIAPVLVLMSGLSGSGKSWIAGQLAPIVPAIHVRSDVERKRLFGLGALARTQSAPDAGIYATDASARTYQRLQEIVLSALNAGFPVIVDATNLRREHRARFVAVARDARCPAAIIACDADRNTIEARVRERLAADRDPSEARMEIVERQRLEFEPPLPAEADLVLPVDTRGLSDIGPLAARLRSLRFT